MGLNHTMEIDRANHVRIVNEKRRGAHRLPEKTTRLSSTRRQCRAERLRARFRSHPEIVVLFQIVNDHVRKMVDVDDYFADAE